MEGLHICVQPIETRNGKSGHSISRMSDKFEKLLCLSVFLLGCVGCSDHLQQGMDAYKNKNYTMAMRELRPLAESGDEVAQNYVGFMYDNGEGVPVDYKQAVEWYSKAAEQGIPIAQHNLAMMYGNGLGVRQDWVQALKWINLAVIISKSKHTQAVKDGNYAVTQMTPEQIKEAEKLTDEWLARHKQILSNQ